MASSEHRNEQTRGGSRSGDTTRTRRRRRRRRPIILTILLRIFQLVGTLLLICVVTGCLVACYAAFYVQTVIIPDAGLDLGQYTLNESSVIVYTDPETGQPVEMRTLAGSEDREWVDYEDIPEHFINAAVAIEDKDFWTHQGVDWWRTAGAVYYMFTGHDIQGGSTITQQLIKNLTGENQVTVKRKIGEIFNALETERDYDKYEIITWYLNYIYLGSNKYGIATASKYYFGKELSEITLAEAASIIAITNNPSIYNPASTVTINTSKGIPWQGRQWNKYRQELILAQMLDQGMISQEEHDAAVAQKLDFAFDDEEVQGKEIFTWYEEAVIDEVVTYLREEHGLSERFAYDVVYGGGLVIYTPFDPNVQACVDQIYSTVDHLSYISGDGQQMQSAITIIDNSNGHVVALAGKMGEKTGNLDMNYATEGVRQPGSSFKPLSAYSLAIEMGLVGPATIIDDSPYLELDDSLWPRNDNRRYTGLSTIKNGITRSINTIAAKLVGDYVTPEASFQFLTERYGLTTLVESMVVGEQIKTDIDVAPLAMGGLTRGVTTFEMAAAFATFPRGGAYTEPTTVLRVETKAGALVWDNEPDKEYVIKPSTAHYMNELLFWAANYGTGGDAIRACPGQTIAGKTGTTNDNYDRWFVGYTDYYTAAVWTGYPWNYSITGTNGENPAARLWGTVMNLVHEGLEKRDLYSVENTTTVSVCLDCGMRATDACASDIRAVMEGVSRVGSFTFAAAGDAPTAYCTCHIPVRICTECPVLDANEAETGAYHVAGEYCPEESVAQVHIVAYTRSEVGAKATVEDSVYHVAYYSAMEAAGTAPCTLHTEAPDDPDDPNGPGGEDPFAGFDWENFDPYNLGTWPFDPFSDPETWPFNPYDPSTWPINSGGGGGGTDPDPGTSTDPDPGTSTDPDPGATTDPDPGETGSGGTDETPPPDGYVPAGTGG